MKTISFALLSVIFASPAAAQAPTPDSVFAQAVAVSVSSAGIAEKWSALAKSLSSNPLFAPLGLAAVTVDSGNQFSHSAQLKLGGTAVNVQGTLRFDPDAKDGQPIASLQSLTTAPDGGRDLSFGNLHALSARLDVVIRNEGGARRLYARVVPSFTNAPTPSPYLELSAGSAGTLGVELVGASLRLADLIPGSGAFPFLNSFVLTGAKKTAAGIAVSGTVDGKPVAVSKDDAKDEFSATGAGLRLSDLVPAAASLKFLDQFALDSLTASGGKFTVSGSLGGKSVTVSADPAAKAFTASGDGLSLANVVPDAAKVPGLGKLVLQNVAAAPGALTVAGTFNGEAVALAESQADKSLLLTGDDLKLADFVPSASGLPFLDAFAFDSLSASTAGVTVAGTISGKAVSVRRASSASADFTVTGASLKLVDIVPEAGGLKAFDALSLSLVSVSAERIKVDGALKGKEIGFVRTRGAKPATTVTAAALTLADLFDPLAGIPTLNAVAVDQLTLDGASIEAQVQLNGVAVDVVAAAKAGTDAAYAAVFFKTLDAATFVPAAQGHAVNDVVLRNALFLIQPDGAAARTVGAADLPGSLPDLAGWGKGETLALSPGINFAAALDVSASGKAAAALKTAGLDAASLPLRGTLSASTFKAMGGKAKGAASSLAAADQQDILSGLNLKAVLPLPKLPAVAGLVAVKGPVVLALGGSAQSSGGPWASVPAALSAFKPAGALDFSLQFGVDVVGAGISETMAALVSLDKGAQPGLSLLAVQAKPWDKPFGVDGLTLKAGGFKFALEKAAPGASTSADLAFFASADIGAKKDVAVSAELVRLNGKAALQYFELDGPFGLSDFPGGKSIPNADKFALDTLKLSPAGIEAKTVLGGKKVDAFLFDAAAAGAAPSWTFAVDQKDFKLTELVPAAKAVKPLADMTLPNAALIITQNGLSLSKASAGIAQDMLADVFGKSAGAVKLPGGVALLAAFDPASMGAIGKGLGRIGVHDDALVIGEVTGVFQGTPGLRLSFSMDQAGAAGGLPKKAMSYKAGVEPSFFLLWGGEDLEVGLKIPMMVKAGKDLLELSSSLELEFMPEGVGIKVLGSMDGTWHKPFGVEGISLANLKMDASIDDVGEVEIGFAGDEQFGKCDASGKGKDCVDVNLAVSMKILLEDALPDGVAFAGKVNELGIPAILDIAETFLKVPGQLSKLPVPFFTVKNAKLAFATPGATDPDLGLVSEGFAFGGTFNFMGKDLGSIAGAGGPTSGVTFKGKISDIDLEVLTFKNNDVDIAVNLKPKFIINSDVKVIGAAQRVKLDIEPPHFEFDVVEKLGVFGDANLTVRLDGFDLQKGTFDKNADISVIGEFKSTLLPWLENEIKKGIDELRQSAGAKLDADSQALKAAQAKVDGINAQIAKIKADDDKAKARATASLTGVEQRVSSLQGSYDHDIHEAHHCGSRWTHWACSPGWYVAAGATYVSLKAAQGVLEAAKAAVAAAFDLDPRLVGLYAERDIETAGLAIAQAVVTASKAVEDFVLKELENVLEAALKDLPFDIEQAILIGDLRGMIANDDPLVLDLKFKLAGKEMHEFFALKIPDSPANADFDAVAFALLPAIALDNLTEAALSKVSPDIRTWLHAHIASKLAEAQEKVRAQVQSEEAKYKDVLATFENGGAKYQSAFADQGKIQADLVAQTDLTDLMPASLEYTNTYLAVGHSALCLTVSKDGVKVVQSDCKDDDPGRWSTAKLADGYVQLKSKGLCLKARQGAAAAGGEPLVLAQCDKADRSEQWKIVTDDGFYDKIVNRDSQKCLHFNDENANPASAYAVWTDCLGADSQNFRDLPDAEKPDYKDVNSMLKAGNGQCLSVTNAAGQSAFTPKPGDTEEKLFARPCDGKNERFNYTELVNGDVKLVHGETGTCLYPKDSSNVAIRPCDTGKDMLWRVNAQGGKGFQLLNTSANRCLMLPAAPKGATQAAAVLTACNRVPNDGLLLDFVK